MKKLPVIYSAHHASSSFAQYIERTSLSEIAQIKFSDYGSDATVPKNGFATQIAKTSRALGDLNRGPDNKSLFPLYDFAKPTPNIIWQDAKELSTKEMISLKSTNYDKYHEGLIDSLKQAKSRALVVAWDNTAEYKIGVNDNHEQVVMPAVILSNLGDEGRCNSTSGQTSCHPETLDELKVIFEELFSEHGIEGVIHTNLVFKGGYIAEFYNTRRHKKDLEKLGITVEVESLQVEYSTAITHDQQTLKPIAGRLDLVRSIAEEAFSRLTSSW